MGPAKSPNRGRYRPARVIRWLTMAGLAVAPAAAPGAPQADPLQYLREPESARTPPTVPPRMARKLLKLIHPDKWHGKEQEPLAHEATAWLLGLER